MGKRWSKEEEKTLIDMWKEGHKASVIAATIGRSEASLRTRKDALVESGDLQHRQLHVHFPKHIDSAIIEMRKEGKTGREIGAELGITVGQVHNRLRSLRRKGLAFGIQSQYPKQRGRACSFAEVIAAVSDKYNRPLESIVGRSRKPKLVEARQVLMSVGYRLSGLSLPQIGQRVCRNHTTVMYAVRVALLKYPQAVSEIESSLLHREAAE